MPNNIKNIITFTGNPNEIHDLMERIKGVNEYGWEISIDFEKIIPRPENVYRGDLGMEEEKLYPGDKNWYGWSIDHWGTKWNAYEHNECLDHLEFETAWAAPHPVIKKLSEMYPNLKITHRWADEDIGYNCGKRVYMNGKILSERAKAEGLPKDVAYARKIWGSDLW